MSSDFLKIGTIQSAFQLDGGLKIAITSDFPERFKEGRTVYVALGSFNKECRIQSFSILKGNSAVLYFEHISDRESAEKYSGRDILIPESEAREFASNLEDNSFLFCDLTDCSVYKDNELWGSVVDLYEGGGGVNLVLLHKDKEYEMPFVEEMVDTGRVAEKRIDIHPVEGLFED